MCVQFVLLFLRHSHLEHTKTLKSNPKEGESESLRGQRRLDRLYRLGRVLGHENGCVKGACSRAVESKPHF